MNTTRPTWQFRMSDCPPFPVIHGVEFRHLDGHVGIACASDGEVWSCRRCGKWKKLSRRSRNSDGYVGTIIAAQNERGLHNLKFASAICVAFHGPRPSPDMEACHKDGTRTNDSADNLYWGTAQDNTNDRVRHGVKVGPASDNSSTAKLTWEDVSLIRELNPRTKDEVYDAANRFGVHIGTIRSIVYRRTWREAP